MLRKEEILEKKKDYHLSQYILRVKNEDAALYYSCMSGSLIILEHDKAEALENLLLDNFSETELIKLIKMGFITKRDEFNDLSNLRNLIVQTRYKQSLGLTILTTTGCNANCSYCFEKGIKKKTLSTKTADNIIEFIKANFHNKPMHISWFGGEPLLNKEIITYISKKISELGIEFNSTMISNGYLIDKVAESDFKMWNLRKIQITLDGIFENYDKVKKYNGVKNAFEKVISNIKRLLKIGIKVVIRINYDPDKLKESIETIEWIYDNFGSDNPLLYVYCVNIFSDDVVCVNNLPIESNPFLIITKKLIDCGYIKNIKQLGFTQKKNFCGIYNNYYVINADGSIYKCEHTCNNEGEILGDVVDGVIDYEKESKWLDTELPSDNCSNCPVLPCCQGNCKSLIAEFGLERTCLQIKKFGETLLRMFYDKYIEE